MFSLTYNFICVWAYLSLTRMLRKYYDADVDWSRIADKTVAVIGYGSQGRAQAANLRDNGLAVIVGVRPGRSFEAASLEGFTTMPVADAVRKADVLAMLVPDESAAEIFRRDMLPWLHDGQTIVFAHGFNIHYGQIVPPPNVDVVMVAPKGVGPQVRRLFLEDSGVASLIAVHQDVTGSAKQMALAFAKGIGSARSVIMESTFADETETDLFGEQTVICGGVTHLIKAAYDTLVAAGYEPEMAYYECMHELKLVVDLLYEGGFTKMHDSVSKTAGYGGLTRGPRVIGPETRAAMQEVLGEIRSGVFAREWLLENQVNRPHYTSLVRLEKESELERLSLPKNNFYGCIFFAAQYHRKSVTVLTELIVSVLLFSKGAVFLSPSGRKNLQPVAIRIGDEVDAHILIDECNTAHLCMFCKSSVIVICTKRQMELVVAEIIRLFAIPHPGQFQFVAGRSVSKIHYNKVSRLRGNASHLEKAECFSIELH